MKKKLELGRSMVEMLGVLAIIGVLSVGGIAGYRYAMDKHVANEILNSYEIGIMDMIGRDLEDGQETCYNNYLCFYEFDTGVTILFENSEDSKLELAMKSSNNIKKIVLQNIDLLQFLNVLKGRYLGEIPDSPPGMTMYPYCSRINIALENFGSIDTDINDTEVIKDYLDSNLKNISNREDASLPSVTFTCVHVSFN